MALADRVQSKPPPPKTGKPCSLGKLVEELPADEVAALTQMLTDGWTAPEIFKALEAEGHIVGFQTINRHRGKVCRCYRQDRS